MAIDELLDAEAPLSSAVRYARLDELVDADLEAGTGRAPARPDVFTPPSSRGGMVEVREADGSAVASLADSPEAERTGGESEPPNLRRGSAQQSCRTCANFAPGAGDAGRCRANPGYTVHAGEVSDDYRAARES